LLLAVSAACLGAASDRLVFSEMDGGEAVLAPGEGESIVVHFWATWCHSCREEFPVLNAAAERCEDAKIRLVAVNVGDSADEIRAFQGDVSIEIPIMRDPEGEVWRRVSGAGFPANLFWKHGKRQVQVGALSPEDWGEMLDEFGCLVPR